MRLFSQKGFLSKILVFLFGLICLFLIYTGATTIVMLIGNGFGQKNYLDILSLLFCGIFGYVAMGTVMIFIAVIAKKTFVTVGIGIGVTYALLWVETNFKDGLLSIVKYTYSYQIGQLQFWGEGFSIWMFLVIVILTFVITLAGSIFIFDKIELK